MSSLFLHPEFFAIAAALVSVPIIIHLINRLRFKRIAWAAMEFLLKAQKRNRRRLIVEQLLLLALRCLLVALVGVLVMRFIGVSFADFGIKQSVHVVLLDDSLSMSDRWKKGETYTNCFEVARDDMLINKIAKKLKESKNPERLIVLPLSAALDEAEPAVYEHLTSPEEYAKFEKEMQKLEPTKLHLSLLDGVKRARKLVADPQAMITFHVLSDFRKLDWGVDESSALHKELVEFAKQRKATINLLDCVADPGRTPSQTAPPAHDNIGIVDLKPRSRMVGRNMPVTFTLSVANYGQESSDLFVDIYRTNTGVKADEVDFIPPLPLKLKPKEITQVTFEMRFDAPDLGDNESYFAAISAHLRGNLEKDGLANDNVGYGVVEVRKQVPVLIVDGAGKAGFEDPKTGRDSFFLSQAYRSVPGASRDDDDESAEQFRPFRVDLPYKKGVTDAMTVLERSDLRQYPAIILANVPSLNPKQLANLEKYVAEGGGLGVFLGPLVDTRFYNEKFFKKVAIVLDARGNVIDGARVMKIEGKDVAVDDGGNRIDGARLVSRGTGVFPVELKDTYYPPAKENKLALQHQKGVPMLLLRDDDPKMRPLPIFGSIFTAPDQRELLEFLPIYRYFQTASPPFVEKDKEGRRVFELATLPNDKPITNYQKDVLDIVRDPDPNNFSKLSDLLGLPKYSKYYGGFARYREALKKLVEPTSQARPFFLALELDKMLKDRGTGGKDSANLEEFWSNADPAVKSLHKEVEDLLDRVRYGEGSPFILLSSFGKGKVVTVMTTAGNLWQDWVGGSPATTVYQPFIWEMQNYLSAQGSDISLTAGQTLDVKFSTEAFDPKKPMKLFRSRLREIKEKEAEKVTDKGQSGTIKDRTLTVTYPNTTEPGVYLAELYDEAAKARADEEARKSGVKNAKKDDKEKVKEAIGIIKPLAASASVFNVDTLREGNLERVGYDVIKVNIIDKSDKRVSFSGVDVSGEEVAGSRQKDLSEAPFIFLIILFVLVLEQALAVHLSFHLKGNESFVPAGQARPAAAA